MYYVATMFRNKYNRQYTAFSPQLLCSRTVTVTEFALKNIMTTVGAL